MGLDQWLYRSTKDGDQIEEIYWRKANHIHKYFTDNWQERGFESDNCTSFPVSEEDLRELSKRCDDILKDVTKAPEILPTTNGFFFGSISYDHWYIKEIEKTKREIDNVLETPLEKNETFIYYAWY